MIWQFSDKKIFGQFLGNFFWEVRFSKKNSKKKKRRRSKIQNPARGQKKGGGVLLEGVGSI